MSDLFDQLLILDEGSREQHDALRQALATDPALREAYHRWLQVRDAVRMNLDATVPDRHLCVLYALKADLLNEAEQQELAAARHGFEAALQVHPGLVDVVADVQAACADFEAEWEAHFADPVRTAPDRPAMHRVRQQSLRRWGWRVLAVAAVVVFGVVSVLMLQHEASMQTIEVAEGTTRLVELADGSTVRLLGGSALTYAAPDDAGVFNRRVQLAGRAFFDVAPGQQGFSVETPTATITVLGTSFGIQADQHAMEVVLASGRVAVAPREVPEQVVVLEPGQMSRVAQNALPATPTMVNLTEALDWTGLLVFRATPLDEVVERIESHFEVSVGVPERLVDEAFTGTFVPEQSVETILDVLATTLDARVEGTRATGFRLIASDV